MEGRIAVYSDEADVTMMLLGSRDEAGKDFGPLAPIVGYSADGRPRRKAKIPVLWRRPNSIADEDGLFPPDCTDPAPQTLSQRGTTHSTGRGGGGAGGKAAVPVLRRADSSGDDDSFEGFSAAHLTMLDAYVPSPDSLAMVPPYWSFRQGPFSCGDVRQGSLGTCWFVSALTVIAERRDVLQRLFRRRPLADALLCAGCIPPEAIGLPAAATAGGAGGGGRSSSPVPRAHVPGKFSSTVAGKLDAMTRINALGRCEDYVDDAPAIPPSPIGVYQVRLCINGLWRVVTLDDHIPVNALSGKVAYTSAQRRQVWVPLLEKAACKVVGSYAGLASGTVAEGLALLTGAPTEQFFVRTNETAAERRERSHRKWRRARARSRGGAHESVDGFTPAADAKAWEYDFSCSAPASVVDAVWARLQGYQECGFPMGASSARLTVGDLIGDEDEDITDVDLLAAQRASAEEAVKARDADVEARGIVLLHAYSLLELRTTPSGARLVRLRNPWAGSIGGGGSGSGKWNGRWSDESAEWDRERGGVRDDFQAFVQNDTGIFWMAIEDFVTYFTRVDVAKVHKRESAWQTVRVALPFVKSGDKTVSVVRVRTLAPHTELEVSVHQQPQPPAEAEGARGMRLAAAPRYVRDDEAYKRDLAALIVQEKAPSPAHATGGGAGGGGAAHAGASASGAAALAYDATGMCHVASSNRRVQSSVTAQTVLEDADEVYYMSPLSFAHYNETDASTLEAGGRLPPCGCADATHTAVLAIHTSEAAVIEVVSKPLSWLARAAACQTISLGERQDFSAASTAAGVNLFTFSDGTGDRVALVNSSPSQPVKYTVTFTNLAALVATRGTGPRSNSLSNTAAAAGGAGSTAGAGAGVELVDVLPPRTFQLASTLVPPAGSEVNVGRSWHQSFKVSYGTTMPESHTPPVSKGGLHAPVAFSAR